MAYFPDLAPYAYSRLPQPGIVHIGWLDNIHDFPKGTVPPHLLEKLKQLALNPVELYRGYHFCELCAPETEWLKHEISPRTTADKALAERFDVCKSYGEIRARGGDIIYAAPMNLPHYIEAHGYLPPEEFLRAIDKHLLPS
jgi:hypothetical protein